MTFDNKMQSNNQFKRYPAVRVFVEDLKGGVWNEEEKNLMTRYGKLKRIRLCGVAIRRREKLEEPQEEDSFLEGAAQTNSRLSFLVDDGTGQLWATFWGVNPSEYAELVEGSLIDIIGKVRLYQENPQVTLEIARMVKDPNYESYH